MSAQKSLLKFVVTLVGFTLAVIFSVVQPLNHAEWEEMEHINHHVEEYKTANHTRYVELQDPEYLSILKGGKELFSSRLGKEALWATLAISVSCAILSSFFGFFDQRSVSVVMAPTIFAVLAGCINPILWLLIISLPFAFIIIRGRRNNVATE